MDDSPRTRGPREGDPVHVQLSGVVVELGERRGEPAALVELSVGEVWVPLSRITLAPGASG